MTSVIQSPEVSPAELAPAQPPALHRRRDEQRRHPALPRSFLFENLLAQKVVVVYELNVGVLVDEDVLRVPIPRAEYEIVQRSLHNLVRRHVQQQVRSLHAGAQR